MKLNAERMLLYKGKSLYSIPVLRLLAYFITRLKLREVIQGRPLNISEGLLNQSIAILSVRLGFLAEVKARIWIY